ncbi:hypothetical protein [Desulfosporosinus shakirovi]|uniref:hypothetical protein n=1 Tax=Desulfosporosinus shakirovi TaxID=2885154 RepID=UPI001E594E7C|nr:hypothetical protein [Desulfosporosinus sp. SRJS8]MCB8814686.1 hypothetical protein [Desulfosporosinus sp. SRJS8]
MLLADDFVEFGVFGRIFDKIQVVEELPHSPAVPMIIEDFQRHYGSAYLRRPELGIVIMKERPLNEQG